jgi:hypothetical protein
MVYQAASSPLNAPGRPGAARGGPVRGRKNACTGTSLHDNFVIILNVTLRAADIGSINLERGGISLCMALVAGRREAGDHC